MKFITDIFKRSYFTLTFHLGYIFFRMSADCLVIVTLDEYFKQLLDSLEFVSYNIQKKNFIKKNINLICKSRIYYKGLKLSEVFF